MRRLNRRKTLNLVKELDAFPKVPDSYVETSASRGTVSLLAFSVMAILTVLEFLVYRDTWMRYDYEVDKDFTSKLRLNIDITVAMKCQYIGADVLDLAETMVTSAEGLVYEPVIFELSPQQRQWQRMLQQIQNRLQEEASLQDLLFKSALRSSVTALPPREDSPSEPPSACRIHGHLDINKVAGNFHITVGKAIPHPRGHAHLAALVSHDSYNFSHRIDHLSFGEILPGIINPLDGTEKIAEESNQMYQYFITIVPTKLNTHKVYGDTHQFSVTERERAINHAIGSHGVSGIFMKYDISSLMVTVTEDHMPLWKFLVRLCGIIGGIFTTTGMIHGLAEVFVDVICCRFKLGVYRHPEENHVQSLLSSNHSTETSPPDPI
ncbi:endoplasmic reticulum-Golgi intermediate compartment protein 2 [Bufo gargarizans]|uniref:endoplasmic reticulum-Golgi intermediate compartment protein 2 n=1 Tax=Bufo gargarizans TaxID=30331 RepID=UPI001CF0F4A7|nr:endoplasmic reticulum-Golgi intermediate compartment protein 2 [Bufo gargarizans]XP_044137348.1 endoplasmic reticulum-Golgi intermediate compartment protein 2 [Bufo gargarizans]